MGLLMLPLFALLTLLAAWASSSDQTMVDVLLHQEASSAGGSLRIYANAVAQFSRVNPAFSGPAPNSSLDLATWFKPQAGTANHIDAGRAYVFFVPGDAQPDLYLMFPEEETGLPYLVGIARSGHLYSPSAGAAVAVLPGAIPEGAVVYVL